MRSIRYSVVIKEFNPVKGQDSIKATTLYSMMSFTYASVERPIEYVQHNEDQEEPSF